MYSALDFNAIQWESVRNNTFDQVSIPPFALVFNDSDDDSWKNNGYGQRLIPVQQGWDENAFSPGGGRRWMVTGPFAIPANQTGIASVPSPNQPMLVSVEGDATQIGGDGAIYTEGVLVGPLFDPITGLASWGVTTSSSEPLWSAMSLVVLNNNNVSPNLYWVGAKEPLDGTKVLKNYLGTSTQAGELGSQTLLKLPASAQANLLEVHFYCRALIDTVNVTLTCMLRSNSTKYPLLDVWQSGRTTPNLALTSGAEQSQQGFAGSENIYISGLVPVDKGDVVRVDFFTSSVCNLVFTDVTMWAIGRLPPLLGSSNILQS